MCTLVFISTWYSSYEDPEVALTCGVMLRECVKHEPLAKLVLEAPEFFNFFGYVEMSTFDIASDAFSTFKVQVIKRIYILHYIHLLYLVLIGATYKTQASLCWISRY